MINGSCCADKARTTANVAGILGALLLVSVLVWIMIGLTRPLPLAEDRTQLRLKNLAELRAADAATLNNYAWQDPPKGIVRLPIEEALAISLREWQNPPAARSNLMARVERATALPPKAPEAPNPYE